MKHFLVVLAATALIAMPANAQDGKETVPTFAAAPGSRVIQGPAIDVPELELPEPGSFTGGPVCDLCPSEVGCTISDGVPVSGDTTGNTASVSGVTGACALDTTIVDAFYEYLPSCTGVATLTGVTAGGSPFVMVHSTTPNLCNVLIACDDTGAGISFNVNVGDVFQLRIGDVNSVGTYTMSVDCVDSVCDNGVFEPGEECDPSAPPPNDVCANGDPCPVDCLCNLCPASEITDDCNGTLSQSTTTDVTAPEQTVTCGGGQVGNNHARCFDGPTEGFSGDIVVNSATFEVSSAADGSTVCINVYAIGSCADTTMHPFTNPLAQVATECVAVDAADAQTLKTVVFANPATIPDGMDIIVEVEVTVGAVLAAQNTIPECDVTYIRADACGLFDWGPMSGIGFGDSHLNLTVGVSCPVSEECGNNVREGAEECDGTDDADCPGECLPDCTCPGEDIPTVSEWGMIALTLLLLAVGGRMIVRRRQLA